MTSFSTALRLSRPRLIILIFLLAMVPSGSVKAEKVLTLSEAIKLAQDHAYSIRASRQDSVASYHGFISARSQRFPTLSLDARGLYIDKLVKIKLLPTEREIGSHENYQTDFKLSIPLYTGGKLSSQINSARAMYEASSYSLAGENMAVALRCRQAWLGLRISQTMVRAAEASLKRIQIIKSDVANLYENGLADSVDILDAELAYEKASEQLLETKKNKNNASMTLAILIGIDKDAPIKLPESLPKPDETVRDYSELKVESPLIKRPELSMLSSQAKAAEYQVKSSKAEYLPIISGFAGYSVGKPNRDFFEASWDDYFSAGLTLSWNFNFGGRVRNNIQSARGRYLSTKMVREDLAEKYLLEAETARENLLYAFNKYEISGREFSIASQQYHLAGEKQKAGRISVNRLLEMESDLTVAEQAYSAAMINYYMEESNFLYAIGSEKIYGGF